VGGVSGRAGTKAGGSNPSACISFVCRGGRRHPGFPEGGSLRGASSERRPRSARLSVAAASSAANERAGDSGCPKVAKEGNDVGLRSLSVDTGRRHETSSHALRDASFTRSFDPCTSILTMLCRGQTRLRWGALEGITAGQTRVTGRNQHWGQRSGRSAARRVSLLCQRSGVVRKKRKVVEAIVPARKRELLVWLLARRKQLQKSSGGVWSRISSAYAQQKLRQGRVNGDLARSERQ